MKTKLLGNNCRLPRQSTYINNNISNLPFNTEILLNGSTNLTLGANLNKILQLLQNYGVAAIALERVKVK